MIARPGASVSALGIVEVVVTISASDLTTGMIMAVDRMGTEVELDASVRAKGTGFPIVGERWVMTKQAGQWVLTTLIGVPLPRVITGNRDGLHDVALQMLLAGAEQGMWINSTTFTPEPVVVEPPEDPDDPEYTDPSIGEDPSAPPYPEEGDGEETEGPPPIEVPPPTTNVPSGSGEPIIDYANKWAPLYVGSYNHYMRIGPVAAEADLRRLLRSTRMQIIGMQEASSEKRNPMYARLENMGWSTYRPKIGKYSDENTIIWKTKDFDLLDKGCINLSTVDVPNMPTRYLNWVKVRYKPANRVFFFMNSHLDPNLDTASGGPNYGEAPIRVRQSFVHIKKIADVMRQFGRVAPVIFTADLNISAGPDARRRFPQFPYARFTAAGSRGNWSAIKNKPHGRAHSIDQIWLTRGADWQVQFVDHWGIKGYLSDHYPVMVQFRIRGKA